MIAEGASLLRRALGWLPLLAALAILSQLYLRGWKPALAEEERLERAEADVHARRDALIDTRSMLGDDETRIQDPIWRERVRRSLRTEGEPLHLVSTEAQRTSQAGAAGAPAPRGTGSPAAPHTAAPTPGDDE